MNSEQEILARTIEDLRRKSTELSNQIRSLEVSFAKRGEFVEQAIDEYTDFLAKLGLLPTVPPPLPLVDLRLEVNLPTSTPRDLVRRVATGEGANLKNDIKGVINSIADYKRREHGILEDDLEKLEEELDTVSQDVDNIEEEASGIESQTNGVLAEVELLREVKENYPLTSALFTKSSTVRSKGDFGEQRTDSAT